MQKLLGPSPHLNMRNRTFDIHFIDIHEKEKKEIKKSIAVLYHAKNIFNVVAPLSGLRGNTHVMGFEKKNSFRILP